MVDGPESHRFLDDRPVLMSLYFEWARTVPARPRLQPAPLPAGERTPLATLGLWVGPRDVRRELRFAVEDATRWLLHGRGWLVSPIRSDVQPTVTPQPDGRGWRVVCGWCQAEHFTAQLGPVFVCPVCDSIQRYAP
jgi:hypothetical protein